MASIEQLVRHLGMAGRAGELHHRRLIAIEAQP